MDLLKFQMEPSKPRNIVAGEVYNRLTVKATGRCLLDRLQYVICQCECGSEPFKVRSYSVLSGNSKSCGCLAKELMTEHGLAHSAIYQTWRNMMARCYNPKDRDFARYGGRGIKVCERWHVVSNFALDLEPKPEGMTIERPDNDADYSPTNWRWADRKEQANNRYDNHLLTYNGKTMNVTQWAEELKINRRTLFARLRYGWPIERILSVAANTRS